MSINFSDALKAKKLRNYFHEQERIYIVVDATSDEVQVPEFLKGDPALRLVLNTRMPQPIYIRDGFVESNFSFSGTAHHCVIPLNRIWAAYVPEQDLDSGLIWDDCVPETVKMAFEAVDELKQHEKDTSPVQLVAKEMSAEKNTTTAGKHNKEKEGKKFGHLRVVK